MARLSIIGLTLDHQGGDALTKTGKKQMWGAEQIRLTKSAG